MITVACVLRSGGRYDTSWVSRLRRGVASHMQAPHRFVCLSDMDVECERFDLIEGWPGWWAKIELFRPGLFGGPVLYFDLDTIITGPLDGLVPGQGFRSVKMWGARAGDICSTSMAWSGDFSVIHRRFGAEPVRWMAEYDRSMSDGRIGDQAFIEDVLEANGVTIDYFPGLSVASYKDHCTRSVPEGVSAVAFHGRPKPDEIRSGWVAAAW